MNSLQSIILGITGGIACGKTETGRILSSAGFAVLDSDFVAHELMAKGQPVYAAVVEHFGTAILAENGEIDRIRLGKIVFEKDSEREALNRLVHPAVIEVAQQWMAGRRKENRDAAVLVPLLFEVGWTDGWDAVVCVTAPEKQIFQRLEKRGLSIEEARRRIAAQMPLKEKASQAEFTVENGGSMEALQRRIMELVEQIKSEKRKTYE